MTSTPTRTYFGRAAYLSSRLLSPSPSSCGSSTEPAGPPAQQASRPDRLRGAGLTGASPEPVQGPAGQALLKGARAQHRGNVNLIDFATAGVFRDYSRGQQSWAEVSVGNHLRAIEAGGVPILTLAGWLDAGTPQGVLSQFTSLSNTQEDWIGPWSHGQGYLADPRAEPAPHSCRARPAVRPRLLLLRPLCERPRPPGGTHVLHYYTLNEGTWHTTARWPVAGSELHTLYLGGGRALGGQAPGR